MTMPEFLNDQAEREGKGRTGGDILSDIFSDMDADSRRVEAELRKPEVALERFKQAIKDAAEYWDDEFQNPLPVLVIVAKVRDAKVAQSFRSSSETLSAEVIDDLTRALFVEYTTAHWSGTRMEPPEDDSEFNFGEFRPMSEHPWKCFRCNRIRETGERHWSHIKKSDDSKQAVHQCPACNGYVAAKRKKRHDRAMARMAREKAKRFGWKR
jgi:hypothetical protein